MKTLYYNVNYACNSNCVFCASDNEMATKGDMSILDILESFRRFGIKAGDSVVLNGGEPTLYPDLVPVIQEASRKQAWITLFTNGRRLSDPVLAREVIVSGVDRITIPLYGASSEKHDAITQRENSFAETTMAIRNVFGLRREYGYPQEIELKCLVCRPTLEENHEVVNLVAREFGSPDRFVVSGLIFSKTVLLRKEELVPSLRELRVSVIQTLQQLQRHGFNTILHLIPLCILDRESLGFYLEQTARRRKKGCDTYVYFDSAQPHGQIVEEPTEGPKHSCCQGCGCARICTVSAQYMSELLQYTNNALTV